LTRDQASLELDAIIRGYVHMYAKCGALHAHSAPAGCKKPDLSKRRNLTRTYAQVVLVVLIFCAPAIRLLLLRFTTFCEASISIN
jgi:hypothetical protein